MTWSEKILTARDSAELKTGRTPTHVAVRQEIWLELCVDNYGDVFEIDGMTVSVSDNLPEPYKLLISLDSLEEA